MNVLTRVVGEGGILMFWCDGCSEYHGVWTESPNPKTGALWTWNGSMDRPTFSPSILLGADGRHPRCHSYVVSGQIQYLPDCAHKLAGQTVPLEPVEDLAVDDAKPADAVGGSG